MFNLVFVYIQGIQELVGFFQLVPAQIQNCQGLIASWNEVTATLSSYFSVGNWVQVISNLGTTVTAHAFDLLGYFTQAMFQLQANDYYNFGVSIGEAT